MPDWRVVAVAMLALAAGCLGGLDAVGDPGTQTEPVSDLDGDARVTSVVDGDTLDVVFADGAAETVRLLGIDTPERHGEPEPTEYEGVPDTAAGRSCLRRAGQYVAAQVVGPALDGASVNVTTDPTADRRGGYGRLLAYVATADREWNRWLVARGYARLYDTDFARRDSFREAERAAQEAGRGLWTCRDGTPNPDWAAASTAAGLTLVTVHADAAGPDSTNLTDEYLHVENRGNRTIDLSGWQIADGADHRYTVPDGVALAPGDELRIVTGSGTDDAETLHWGASDPIWNNDGDVVRVWNTAGELVIEYTY